ncbi:MAG: TAXI family TRAP transporter solute-binding subunit [Microcoleaceae cyanobacterium]
MRNRLTLAPPILLLSLIGVSLFTILFRLQNSNQAYTLILATAGKNGQYYAFGDALAKIVAKHDPKIRLQVIETEGSRQNIELLNQNKAQLALVQSNITLNLSIQLVSFLFPEIFHLVATRESDIQNASDLRGKRIAIMPKGSGSNDLFWELSEHYGFIESDFQAIPFSPEEAHTALQTRQVDALFRVVTLGTPAMSRLLQSGENVLVPIDQSAALQLFQPALETSQIPRGTYNGSIPIPAEDLITVSVRALLVAREDVPEDIIRDITRILFEARNELIAINPQAALIRQPESMQPLGFSFHPGAQQYYTQDEPSFLERYADSIGLMLSVTALVASGLWQLKLWFQRRQKNRADFYNLELLSLIDEIPKISDIEHLEEIRHQLFQIFKEVVIELDGDRISAESFQSFTFTWQAAIATIRHQENLLRSL